MASVRQLLLAKLESDRRNYAGKYAKLRALIQAAPQEFTIDSDDGRGIVGLTHTSGFRAHLPRQVVPPILFPRSTAPPA